MFSRKHRRKTKAVHTVVIPINPSSQSAKLGVAGYDGKVKVRFQGHVPDWMKEVAAAIEK